MWGGIFNSIHIYAKANDKYVKDCDKNKESSYIQYWDVNNLYGWTIPSSKQFWVDQRYFNLLQKGTSRYWIS